MRSIDVDAAVYAGAKGSGFPAAYDRLTWAEFADELAAMAEVERPTKAACLAWAATTLADPAAPRADANVVALTALAIDVDAADVDAIEAALEYAGWDAVVYGSPSDDEDAAAGARRVRVVVGLDAPIPADRIRHARRALAELVGVGPGCGVEHADARSQIMFAGRVRGSDARYVRILRGGPAPADALASLPLTAAWPDATRRQAATVAPLPLADVAPDARAQALAAALAPLWPAPGEAEGRRQVLRALGGYLARRGWSDAQIAAAVGLLPTARPTAARVRLAVDAARQARDPDAPVTAGWAGLVDWSEDGARVVESIARDPREPRGWAGVWTEWWARYLARRGARATAAVAAADTAATATPVLLVTRRGSRATYYVRDFRPGAAEGTYQESSGVALLATIRDLRADAYLPTRTEKGSRVSVTELTADYAATVRDVEWDYRRGGAIEYDPTRETVLCGNECPAIDARYDEGAARWLRALAGSDAKHQALCEWISSTRQDQIHRLATALLIVGPHGVGKSLFAAVCARLWGQHKPVDLAACVGQFNADMTRCPIVLDDEAKTLSGGLVTTEAFRTLIQERVRTFEPKGHERRTLHGAQRFIVTANDLSAFRFAGGVGAGAVDAIAERLLQVVVDEARAGDVRSALDALRGDDGDPDMARLVGHFAWVRQTTALPDARARFYGSDPDRDATRATVLAGAVEGHLALYDALRDALDAEGDRAGVIWHGGTLWVRPAELAVHLAAVDGSRWTAERIVGALSAVVTGRRWVRRPGGVVRARELDLARLQVALGE